MKGTKECGMGEERVIWDKLWFLTGILMRKGHPCTPVELGADSHLLKFTSEEVEALCYFPNSPLSMTDNGKVTFSHLAFSFFDNIKDCYEKPSSPFIWESQPSSLDPVNSYIQESHSFALKSFSKHFSSLQEHSSSLPSTDSVNPCTSEHFQVSFPSSTESPLGTPPISFFHLSPSYSISCTIPGLKNLLWGVKQPGFSLHPESENGASEEKQSEKESFLSQNSKKRTRKDYQCFTLCHGNSKIPKLVASDSTNVGEASDHSPVSASFLSGGSEGVNVEPKEPLHCCSGKNGGDGDTPRLMEPGAPFCTENPVSFLVDTGLESGSKASDGEENVGSYGLDSNCPEKERGFTNFARQETLAAVRSDTLETAGSSKPLPLTEILQDEGRADMDFTRVHLQEQGVLCQNKHVDSSKHEMPPPSANHMDAMCPENSDNITSNFTSKNPELFSMEEDLHSNVLPLSEKADKQEGPFCSACSNSIVSDNQPKYQAFTKDEKAERQRKTYPAGIHSPVCDMRSKPALLQKPMGNFYHDEATNEENTVDLDTEDQQEVLAKVKEKQSLMNEVVEIRTCTNQNLDNSRQFKKPTKPGSANGHGVVLDDGIAGHLGAQSFLGNDAGAQLSLKQMAQFVPMRPLKFPLEEEEETDCSPSDLQLVELSQKCSDSLDKRSRHQKWFKDETLMLLHGKKYVDEQFVDTSSRKQVINSSTKWDLVSAYCVRHGTERSAIECQKKWNNLCTDYKRVRDYEESGSQSYWGMSWGKRKELKLHTSFDREVYDLMEGLLGRRRVATHEAFHEASATSFDRSEQDGSGSNVNRLASGETQREDVSTPPTARRKRKESLSEEELKERLVASLEATRTTLAGGISTQLPSMNAQVANQIRSDKSDKEKPKQTAESMACVLGKLASSLGEIAKKL